jgi:hypothetical protein
MGTKQVAHNVYAGGSSVILKLLTRPQAQTKI